MTSCFPKTCHAVISSERWIVYERFPDERRQICRGHLRRDFQAAIDRGGKAKPAGQQLLDESDRMFRVWHAFRRGEMDRLGLAQAMGPVQDAWSEGLIQAHESADRKLQALATYLWDHWEALGTFVRVTARPRPVVS